MICVWMLFACAAAPEEAAEIRVRWYPSAGDEDPERARQGLGWALANLGAVPRAWDEEPAGDGWVQVLDREELGLPADFDDAWAPLGASEEMARFGAVDVGRFVMRVAVGPARYARITGACPTLAEWQVRLGEPDTFTITNSLLVSEPRQVELSQTRVAISVTEPGGAADVLDLLANGQPRYAAYDDTGALIPASVAGGPVGRCQWCHEDHLQPMPRGNHRRPGDLRQAEMQAWVAAADAAMAETQAGLDTVVDFETHDVHEWLEKLLDAFLNPSPERVAAEWGEEAPRDLPTHDVEEWGWTGRYTRADVDAAWDGQAVPVMPEFRQYDPDADPEAELLGGDCRE